MASLEEDQLQCVIDAPFSPNDFSEIDELPREHLLSRFAEMQRQLYQSATLGKSLLEQKEQITNFYEDERKKNTYLIEELRQENHALQVKLGVAEKNISSITQEVDDVEKRLTKNFSEEKVQLISSHESALNEEKRRNKDLLHENNKLSLQQKQLEEDIEALNNILQEERCKVSDDLTSVTQGTEVFELHEKIISLEGTLECHEAELRHSRHKLEEIELERASLAEKNAYMETELEAAKCKETQLLNECQRASQECSELQTQIDFLKSEANNHGHLEKGNSLFGEVYDKQIEAERKYISIKTKYDALQKVDAFQKDQLCKMKTQILSLLQLKGGDVDGNRIHQLESALAQKRGEIADLNTKISHLESVVASSDPAGQIQKYFDSFIPTSATVNKGYLDFVLCKLKNSQEEASELKKELEKARLIQLSEFDKFQASEKKLYSLEEKYDHVKGENLRLKSALEEVRNKLRLEKIHRQKLESEPPKDTGNTPRDAKCKPGMITSFDPTKYSTVYQEKELDASANSMDASVTSESGENQVNNSLNSSTAKKDSFKRPHGMSDADYKLYKVLPKDVAEKLIKQNRAINATKENLLESKVTTSGYAGTNLAPSIAKGKVRKVSFKESVLDDEKVEEDEADGGLAAVKMRTAGQPLASALKKTGDSGRKAKLKPRVAMLAQEDEKPECNQQ